MTTVEAILQVLEREPEDLITVAALTDALIEERDMNRSEADRYAERAVQAARDARDIAAAAELLRADQPWHTELVNDVVEACGLLPHHAYQVVIAPGESQPIVSRPPQSHPAHWWTDNTITVGALWVIRHWRAHPSLCLYVPTKRRYRRAPR